MVLQKSPEKAVLWGYGPEGAQVNISLSGPMQQKSSPAIVTKGEHSLLLTRGRLTITSAGQGMEAETELSHQDGSRFFFFCIRAFVV